MQLNRRKFINTVFKVGLLGAIAAIFYPVTSFLMPPEKREAKVNSLKIGKVDEFEPNSSKIVKFGRQPVIVINDKNNNLKALAATCTHLDCIVQYSKDQGQITCACHNGVYDLKGRNISGPPPKPLEEFDVNVIDEEIIVTTKKS